MLAWPSGGQYAAGRLPKNMHRPYIEAAQRGGMAAVAETPMFATSIKKNPKNRERLLAQDPQRFARQMEHWERYFTASGHLPTAGCRLTEAEWRSIRAPAIVTGGVDPVHPTAVAQKIRELIPNCAWHDPVVTAAEWDAIFNVKPYPETAVFQGQRIAPVWREFMKSGSGS